MKPPHTNPSERPPVGDTQVIDLQDVELLVAAHALAQEAEEQARSRPPPLPPEVRASHVPEQPPSGADPASVPAPPPRSAAFYLLAIAAFLALGIGGGLLFAMRRAPLSAAPAASKAPQAAVITIPTIEVGDDIDGGK